jgi:hypothetical protein
VILIFVNIAIVIESVLTSTDASANDLEREGIHTDERLTGDGSASAQDPPIEVETAPAREITVCDVALVSRHIGAIDHDAACGLLMECL